MPKACVITFLLTVQEKESICEEGEEYEKNPSLY